jgi:pyruvate formate-lyase activating enzyme-like uncharacterized protein
MNQMKRKVQDLEGGSMLVGTLPTGCALCARGSKMVLFITGICDSSCFYCPLSLEKKDKDVVFADEMPVQTDDDTLTEAHAIGAEGVGISGGDPLCRLDRTLHNIALLRDRFGPDFHIHLYTSMSDASDATLRALMDAGLDEIRFHPQSEDWSGIERAVHLGLDVGIEIPALPEGAARLREVATRAAGMGVKFMNINELEASESNFERLRRLGMRLTDLSSASIEGSVAAARDALQWAAESLDTLSVHFCSACYKDAVQMRNRLERRLVNTIREFEERDDEEPLVILGIIRAQHGAALTEEELMVIHSLLMEEFDVPDDLINLDLTRKRIEIAPWIIDEIGSDLRKVLPKTHHVEMGIAVEYPTWDRFQTMFSPV